MLISTKTTPFTKEFNETKFMFFMKQNELLKKYNNVWEQVTSIIYKYFESSPVCKEKYIRTKIIPVIENSTQIFMTTRYQKKVLKLFVCRCFSLIFLEQVKFIILKYFQRSVNTSPKVKRPTITLLMMWNFLILMKTVIMRKFLKKFR